MPEGSLVHPTPDPSGHTCPVTTAKADLSLAENIIGFTPQTRIATPQGLRCIEDLYVGDLVVTRDHGLQPLRWTQSRRVPARGRCAPVRIRSKVLSGLEGDLIVSPRLRVLFQGDRAQLLFGQSEVLVAAEHLVDGLDVTREEGGPVTYIHLLFDQHEVIYAEGAATESFHPASVEFSARVRARDADLFAPLSDRRLDHARYGCTARRYLRKHEVKLIRT